jgi:hypothetical protein
MSPGLPSQIALPLSRLFSSCGIPEIVYLAFRKWFKVIGQPPLNMGPTGLDANGGAFVASFVPHERAAKASAWSAGALSVRSFASETWQEYAKYLGIRRWDPAGSRSLTELQMITFSE